MASDLRVVIATRGAVWSHRIEKRSDNLRNMVDSRDDEEKGVTSDGNFRLRENGYIFSAFLVTQFI